MERAIPQQMKAAAIDRYGGPEVLHTETLPVPKPKQRQVHARLLPAQSWRDRAATAHRELGQHHLGKVALRLH